MRRILAVLSVLSLSAAVPVYAASTFEGGVRGTYWFPSLSANIKTTSGGVTGQFDAKKDLGVGDESFPSGEAFIRAGRFTFRVGYTPVSFDGTKTITQDIVFNGQTFTATDTVVTNLDLNMLDGEIQVDILRPNLEAVNFNLGIIVKVKYIDGKATLQGSTLTESKTFQVPIPMVGIAAGAGFLKDMVRVDARATGITYSNNHLYEGDVFVSFIPLPFFRIQGGYRLFDLNVDTDDVVAKFKLNGPYVGAQLSF